MKIKEGKKNISPLRKHFAELMHRNIEAGFFPTDDEINDFLEEIYGQIDEEMKEEENNAANSDEQKT